MERFRQAYRKTQIIHDGEREQGEVAAAALSEQIAAWRRAERDRRISQHLAALWRRLFAFRSRLHFLRRRTWPLLRRRGLPPDRRLRRLQTRQLRSYRRQLRRLGRVATWSWPAQLRLLTLRVAEFRLWFTWRWRLLFALPVVLAFLDAYDPTLLQSLVDALFRGVLGP